MKSRAYLARPGLSCMPAGITFHLLRAIVQVSGLSLELCQVCLAICATDLLSVSYLSAADSRMVFITSHRQAACELLSRHSMPLVPTHYEQAKSVRIGANVGQSTCGAYHCERSRLTYKDMLGSSHVEYMTYPCVRAKLESSADASPLSYAAA